MADDTSLAFVDTNILVYAFEGSKNEPRCALCTNIVENCFSGASKLVVSNQVLAEFFYVALRKSQHPLPAKDVRLFVSLLCLSVQWEKLVYTPQTVLTAIEFSERYLLPFWDALIAATMIENSIYIIYTENEKDFSKIPGIKVMNPLK